MWCVGWDGESKEGFLDADRNKAGPEARRPFCLWVNLDVKRQARQWNTELSRREKCVLFNHREKNEASFFFSFLFFFQASWNEWTCSPTEAMRLFTDLVVSGKQSVLDKKTTKPICYEIRSDSINIASYLLLSSLACFNLLLGLKQGCRQMLFYYCAVFYLQFLWSN